MAPSTPSSSKGSYAGESLKLGLDILFAASDALPAPVKAIINVAREVIKIAENVESNWEECRTMKDRILQLLPVVIMSAKDEANTGDAFISETLAVKITQFQGKLEGILEVLKSMEKTKGFRRSVKAVLSRSKNTDTLKKCNTELDWEMKVFQVDLHLEDATRLAAYAKDLQDMRTNIKTLQSGVSNVHENVQEVQAGVSDVHAEVLNTRRDVQATLEALLRAEDQSRLERLPRAKNAAYDSGRRDSPNGCLEGTRVQLLGLIQEWLADAKTDTPRIFWLNGIAGTGKTAVAYSVAQQAEARGQLAASFFFSRRGESELRDPSLVLPTIAYQLSHFRPEFSLAIAEALKKRPNSPYGTPTGQLSALIIDPLSRVEVGEKRVAVIVFDAFDECEEAGAREILLALVASARKLPFNLKIFLTGRPEPHIRTSLGPSEILHTTVLHEIESTIVRSDIELYLRSSLESVPHQVQKALPKDWVGEKEVQLLTDQTGSMFIYAAIAMRFVSDTRARNPQKQLKIVMGLVKASGASPFSLLDQLYLHVLNNAIPPTNPVETVQRFRVVIGTMLIVRDSLSEEVIERLAGIEEGEVADALYHLHSIASTTSPNESPRFHHKSFPDFIQDIERCPDPRFFIDIRQHETRLALRCLKILEDSLHRGMIGDVDPNADNWEVDFYRSRVRASFPIELRYACRHWCAHLSKADIHEEALKEALRRFCDSMAVWWVESMSWLGSLHQAVDGILSARTWAISASCEGSTISLLTDVHRLFVNYWKVIRDSAMSLYVSILPFIPENTELYRRYEHERTCLIQASGSMAKEWPVSLRVMNPPKHKKEAAITALAFSPDERHVLSGRQDGGLVAWDIATGRTEFFGDDVITSAVFSPDGSQVALCTAGEGYIFLSEPGDLNGVTHTMKLQKGTAFSLAWSPTGDKVACGTSVGSIQMWDATTEAPVGTSPPQSSPVVVRALEFSPDGRMIAYMSASSLKLWELLDGGCSTLSVPLSVTPNSQDSTPSCSPMSIAFTFDGQLLLSGWDDSTVRIWDTSSKESLSLIQTVTESGFTGGKVTSWAFARDGERWASGWSDGRISMHRSSSAPRDEHTGNGSDAITHLAFSRQGDLLVSGCNNGKVEAWDLVQEDLSVFCTTRHNKGVTSIDFSADGKYVASGSLDKTVRVWDSVSGQLLRILEVEDEVEEVHFCGEQNILKCRVLNVDSDYVWDLSTWTRSEEIRDPDSTGICRERGAQEDGWRHSGPYVFRMGYQFLYRAKSKGAQAADCLCYLPRPLRPVKTGAGTMALRWHGSRVALGGRSGQVTILETDVDSSAGGATPSMLPTCWQTKQSSLDSIWEQVLYNAWSEAKARRRDQARLNADQ